MTVQVTFNQSNILKHGKTNSKSYARTLVFGAKKSVMFGRTRAFRNKSRIYSAKLSNSSIDGKYKYKGGKNIALYNERDGKNAGHIIRDLVILNGGF